MNINFIIIGLILIVVLYSIINYYNNSIEKFFSKSVENFEEEKQNNDIYKVDYDPYDSQYAVISNIIYKDDKVIENDITQILDKIPKIYLKILDMVVELVIIQIVLKNINLMFLV